MYEVGVVEQFEAAHRLVGDFGPATQDHSHVYRVEVILRGERLRQDGTLYDIGKLSESLKAILGELRFKDLNALPAFAGRNTTAEVVADHILDRVTEGMGRGRLRGVTVRLWESPEGFAASERTLE